MLFSTKKKPHSIRKCYDYQELKATERKGLSGSLVVLLSEQCAEQLL